jgi:hypothetical protein
MTYFFCPYIPLTSTHLIRNPIKKQRFRKGRHRKRTQRKIAIITIEIQKVEEDLKNGSLY